MTHTETPPRPFRFSREQYYKHGELGFFDGKRVERLRGQIIDVATISWPHVVCMEKIEAALAAPFAAVAWVSHRNPLPTEDSDPQPDLMIVPGRMRDYTDHPRSALLVVEVADTTFALDATMKANIYATAGVLDYWVVDLLDRELVVFREPTPLSDGGSGYRTRLTFGPTDRVSPLALPTASIAVADLLP